jgi:hypothetical protein
MFVASFLLDCLPAETKSEDSLLFNLEDGEISLKSHSLCLYRRSKTQVNFPSYSQYFNISSHQDITHTRLHLGYIIITGNQKVFTALPIIHKPSETDVVQFRWLEFLFCNSTTLYAENEYLLIIGQIQWRQIGNAHGKTLYNDFRCSLFRRRC